MESLRVASTWEGAAGTDIGSRNLDGNVRILGGCQTVRLSDGKGSRKFEEAGAGNRIAVWFSRARAASLAYSRNLDGLEPDW